MVTTVVLLGFVMAAAATDVTRHRIYNWTTYPGTAAAVGWSLLGHALIAQAGADPDRLGRLGWIPVTQSLAGLAACFAVMLVCFVLFRVGGGDVKLIAMMGAFLGLEQGIEAMLWTFVIGGCLGLVVLVWRVGPWRLLGRVARQVLWTLRLGSWAPLSDAERAQLQQRLWLAPCAVAAVVIVRFQLIERL
jgi:prepilin peptidase CpaA